MSDKIGQLKCAVLIMDRAGFSAFCELDGRPEAARDAAHAFWALGRVHVEAHGGTFVKGFGDDFAAVFPTVQQAQEAALGICRAVPSSAGIGYGEILLEDGDLWGVEVNRASRLGEDVAQAGEVLLTPSASSMMACQ